MTIPAVNPVSGLLPQGIHPANLAEIEVAFVQNAPFPAERERLFGTMVAYVDIIWDRFPSARILLNGGFVTHKTWAAPEDVDFAIGLTSKEFRSTKLPHNISLWTQGNVSMEGPEALNYTKIQPMGGHIDGYFFPNALTNMVRYWEDHWGKVKGPDGKEIIGARKGYLEVTP